LRNFTHNVQFFGAIVLHAHMRAQMLLEASFQSARGVWIVAADLRVSVTFG
jgi:hypothetical protein